MKDRLVEPLSVAAAVLAGAVVGAELSWRIGRRAVSNYLNRCHERTYC